MLPRLALTLSITLIPCYTKFGLLQSSHFLFVEELLI